MISCTRETRVSSAKKKILDSSTKLFSAHVSPSWRRERVRESERMREREREREREKDGTSTGAAEPRDPQRGDTHSRYTFERDREKTRAIHSVRKEND